MVVGGEGGGGGRCLLLNGAPLRTVARALYINDILVNDNMGVDESLVSTLTFCGGKRKALVFWSAASARHAHSTHIFFRYVHKQ